MVKIHNGNWLELRNSRKFYLEVVYPFFECPVEFFAEIVARGNAVQINSNFPAKRLNI